MKILRNFSSKASFWIHSSHNKIIILKLFFKFFEKIGVHIDLQRNLKLLNKDMYLLHAMTKQQLLTEEVEYFEQLIFSRRGKSEKKNLDHNSKLIPITLLTHFILSDLSEFHVQLGYGLLNQNSGF
jgi:hypothetical protein